MEAFVTHTGMVMPLDRPNVDTDAIIPKQYLKSIRRTGFGPYLFDDWRYLDEGDLETPLDSRRLNPEFVLNQPRYQGASILLARENFGCGSSREHAVWALKDAGFRAVIAPSFADIFHSNCFKNGVLPIQLPSESIEGLFAAVAANEGYQLIIDLEGNQVTTAEGQRIDFTTDAFRRDCLLQGLDEIGLTLKEADAIREFEQKRRIDKPWLFSIDEAAASGSSGVAK